jgi:hypothetical protein
MSVVLPPAVAATLSAIAEETGDSASSLVRGLLEQAHPALERMLQLVRAAKQAKGGISSGIAGSLDRVITDLEDAMDLADGRAGRVIRDLVSEAEAVKGRRRTAGRASGTAAAGGPSDPRPVTRGSGPQPKARTRGRRAGHGGAV